MVRRDGGCCSWTELSWGSTPVKVPEALWGGCAGEVWVCAVSAGESTSGRTATASVNYVSVAHASDRAPQAASVAAGERSSQDAFGLCRSWSKGSVQKTAGRTPTPGPLMTLIAARIAHTGTRNTRRTGPTQYGPTGKFQAQHHPLQPISWARRKRRPKHTHHGKHDQQFNTAYSFTPHKASSGWRL